MMGIDRNDENFDRNLAELGRQVARPGDPSAELRSRCAERFSAGGGPAGLNGRRLRRPALLSGLGLAAAVMVAVGLLFPSPNGTHVRAATVLAKLTEQVHQGAVFEVVLDRVAVGDVHIDGRIQIADRSLAGDLNVAIDQGAADGLLEADVAVALSPDTGWVLVRKLIIPEPDVQPFVTALFPAGTQTLLVLPPDALKEAVDSGFNTDLDEIRALASGQAAAFIKEVLRSESELGALITHRRDGTVVLTTTVEDTESLANLIRLAARAVGGDASHVELDADDGEELIGATLQVVYDPATETVRSFSISNIADVTGTITVSLSEAGMDPLLFDSSRVAGPDARVWDLSAFESVIKALEKSMKE